MGRTAKKEVNNQPESQVNFNWEFKNVIPIYRNNKIVKFSLSASVNELAEMSLSKKIIYNENIQRGTKINSKGNVIEIFQPKKVKEIYEAILEDRLHGSVITLNANKDIGIELIYDEDNFILKGDKPLDLIDGNHRLKSMVKFYMAYQKGKVIPSPSEYNFPVIIENLTEQDAAACFSEYGILPLKISRTRGEFLNVYDGANRIIRYLMKNSELRNKIDCISTNIKENNIVTFSNLANAINTHLKPKTNEEAESISLYLTNYFDKLVNLFSEVMGNVDIETRQKYRKEYFTMEPLFFAAYVALAKALVGRDNIDNELKKLKNEVVVKEWKGSLLSRKNPYWINNITRAGDKIVSTRATGKFVADSIVNYIINGELKA